MKNRKDQNGLSDFFAAWNILLKNTQGIRQTASVQQLCRVKVLLTLQYFQMDMRLLGAFVGNAACTAKYLAHTHFIAGLHRGVGSAAHPPQVIPPGNRSNTVSEV